MATMLWLRSCALATGVAASGVARRGFAANASQRSEASLNELYMRAVEPKMPEKPVLPVEERNRMAGIATLYSKLRMRRSVVMGRDLNRKAKLKWAAIYALPTEQRRREALVVDPYVPLDLRVPRVTPPLAGFHGPEEIERERVAAEAARKAAEAAARLAAAEALKRGDVAGAQAASGAGAAAAGGGLGKGTRRDVSGVGAGRRARGGGAAAGGGGSGGGGTATAPISLGDFDLFSAQAAAPPPPPAAASPEKKAAAAAAAPAKKKK